MDSIQTRLLHSTKRHRIEEALRRPALWKEPRFTTAEGLNFRPSAEFAGYGTLAQPAKRRSDTVGFRVLLL